MQPSSFMTNKMSPLFTTQKTVLAFFETNGKTFRNWAAKNHANQGFDTMGASSRSLGMTLARPWIPVGIEKSGAKRLLPASPPGCAALFPSGQQKSFCIRSACFPSTRKKSQDAQSYAAAYDGVSADSVKIRRPHLKPTDAWSDNLWASDHSSEAQ